MISRLFQLGNGGRTNGIRQAAASPKRIAATSRGGMVSVASLAAALLTPQITTTATMAAISRRQSGLCGVAGVTRLAYASRLGGARAPPDKYDFRLWQLSAAYLSRRTTHT